VAKTTRSATEHKIEEFAEDLGRLLGTARAKAEGWMGQRQNIAKQLAGIRDTASDLLQELTKGGARMAAAVRRGRGLGRSQGSRNRASASGSEQPKRRKLSAKARKAISDAQKRRWAAQKAAEKKK
jgi:hypothetical protein